jgi:pimeloyl-ACP methyl ester carboxylesterase
MSQYIYLHGWSSSPQSAKARLFKQQFAQANLNLSVPDFNQPDFYSLSLSRQIQQVSALCQADTITLIGSSFGALTALWLAQQNQAVKSLVLLAPALSFQANIQRLLGYEAMQRWRREGRLSVFHHGLNQAVPIGYHFFEDLQQYPDNALMREMPTLILHGKDDEVIPVGDVEKFAGQRPWIDLRILDGDHGLLNCDLWTPAMLHCQIC